jgi:hypothetical protein
MQHEGDTFGGGQAVHHDMQRDADRLGQQDLLLGRRRPTPGFRQVGVAEQLVEVDLDRNLTARAPVPQHVQTDPARDRRQPGTKILDAVPARPAQPQPGLLNRVVGVVAGPQHPQRDRPHIRAVPLELGGEIADVAAHLLLRRPRRF